MLSLEQKLYQLIINRLEGEKLSSLSYQNSAVHLVHKGIGGFILFGGMKDETRNFIDKLQSLSETPLFIASDIERGVGQQVGGATRFPSQMAVAAAISRSKAHDAELLEHAINSMAQEALDIGINMPLIPVLDVNRNPDNPIICTRAFSDDPEEVAWFGRVYVETLEGAGVISCAKHFPGHGDTSTDSHIELPVISKSMEELKSIDISPFREAIQAGVSSIMLGHLAIPAIDVLPAPLSKKIITDLLRKELSYEGIVLTDALNMRALKQIEHVPARCINAGADILLHPEDPDSVVADLKQAVSSGEVEEVLIDIAVERILKYKSKIKKIESSHKKAVNYKKHEDLSKKISEKSVTLVKDTAGVLPVADIRDVHLAFAGEKNFYSEAPLRGFMPDNSVISAGAGVKPAPTIVVAIFTSIAAWKGSSGISEEDVHIIREMIKMSRHSMVISFGSPYVLRYFDEAEVLIAAYDASEQAQLSVIKCLKGEQDFQGRLPVILHS